MKGQAFDPVLHLRIAGILLIGIMKGKIDIAITQLVLACRVMQV
jgi:hypothetical protein